MEILLLVLIYNIGTLIGEILRITYGFIISEIWIYTSSFLHVTQEKEKLQFFIYIFLFTFVLCLNFTFALVYYMIWNGISFFMFFILGILSLLLWTCWNLFFMTQNIQQENNCVIWNEHQLLCQALKRNIIFPNFWKFLLYDTTQKKHY
jgi:hypothetical protein